MRNYQEIVRLNVRLHMRESRPRLSADAVVFVGCVIAVVLAWWYAS